MTNKERMHAVLEGRPVDRMPVTVLYNQLYHLDHFAELSGREEWERQQWLIEKPEEHLNTYRTILAKVPFEILQPQMAASRPERENVQFIRKDGVVFRHDKRTGKSQKIEAKKPGDHASHYTANETCRIFDKEDVKKTVKIKRAEEILSEGTLDYARAVVQAFGRDEFILTAGLTGILWACIRYLGQTNTLRMLVENPDLVEYLSQTLLEQELEKIRAYGAVGGDAIYIDDAMAYSDVISVKHYERFSLPYLTKMVKEIHRLDHKVILIYFGGITDRLAQIVSSEADGLSMETSMKNYVNDIDEISGRIGRRISLFGNIDPVGVLQNGTDVQLETEIKRQAAAGKKARGFVLATGSPITPATPLKRVKKFLELGRSNGAY